MISFSTGNLHLHVAHAMAYISRMWHSGLCHCKMENGLQAIASLCSVVHMRYARRAIAGAKAKVANIDRRHSSVIACADETGREQ